MKKLLLVTIVASLPLAAQTPAPAGVDPLESRQFRAAIAEAVSLADRNELKSLRTDEVNDAGEIVDSHFHLPGHGECYLEPKTARWLECSVKCHGAEEWMSVFGRLEAIFATLPQLQRVHEVRRKALWVDEYKSTAASQLSMTWDPSFTPRVILLRFTSPESPAAAVR